jgi:hypothetical protein
MYTSSCDAIDARSTRLGIAARCELGHHLAFAPYIVNFLVSVLLTLDRRDNLPRVLHIPKLQIPDALPCTCVQPTICDRDGDTRTDKRRLDMCRHIITALCVMQVQTLALLILRHNPVQRRAHVGAYVFVVVLIQAERARCVLDEEVQQPGLVALDLRQLFQDGVGYEVRAPAARGQGELFLEPGPID